MNDLINEIVREFDKRFDGLPPNWCSNCHTLGAAFPNDYICGNCNYDGIGHFKEFLRSKLTTLASVAEARGVEKAKQNMISEGWTTHPIAVNAFQKGAASMLAKCIAALPEESHPPKDCGRQEKHGTCESCAEMNGRNRFRKATLAALNALSDSNEKEHESE